MRERVADEAIYPIPYILLLPILHENLIAFCFYPHRLPIAYSLHSFGECHVFDAGRDLQVFKVIDKHDNGVFRLALLYRSESLSQWRVSEVVADLRL